MRHLILAIAALWAAPAAAETLECLIEPEVVVDVAMPVEGVVEAIAVDRGDRVRRGDVVAHLEAAMERITVEMAERRAENETAVEAAAVVLENERRKLERAETLHRRGTLADAQHDEARIAVDVAVIRHRNAVHEQEMAEVELARSRAMLERRTVRSPIDGVVLQLSLQPGEYAHEQASVARIARINPLRVEAFAPLEMFGQIAPGDRAGVRPVEPIGGLHQGTVEVVDSVFDAASGTFGVRIILPNPAEAIPSGLRCSVELAAPG
jgi:RND family efflux transporter MFP subunit